MFDATGAALIVVAHPDDEVLAAGVWMMRRRGEGVHILHITDGSPMNLAEVRAHGYTNRAAYSAARRRELADALSLVVVPEDHCHFLPIPDREAHLHVGEIVKAMARLCAQIRPSVVMTHAYEGGHPDHDTASFAVSLVRHRCAAFQLLDFPLYHADDDGEMIASCFLESEENAETVAFTGEERNGKRAMLSKFCTQQEMIERFPMEREIFRIAPVYDFARPPHPGRLLYERWGWDISWREWRARTVEFADTVEPCLKRSEH